MNRTTRRRRAAGTAAVWAPTSASTGVNLWLRADVGVTGTAPVTAWADQSGAGDANRNQALSVGAPPLTAADAAYGDKATIGSDALWSMVRGGAWSASPAAPITIVVVGEITGTGIAYLSDGAAENMLWRNATPEAKFYSGAGALASAVDIGTPSVTMFTDDGTGGGAASKLYVNDLGTAAASSTTLFAGGTGGFDVGVGVAGVANMYGKIAEIIVFGGVLTAGDKTNLVTYLNTTRAYGIGVT